MAGNIKGITIQFRGETTELDKSLKTIKNEANSVDQQLREVNRSLRFNPRNVELMRQKFTLLGQKVDATEKELKELRNVERQLKAQGVSKESAEWMKVRRSIIEAESKLKHFQAEQKKLKYANVTAMGNAFKTAGSSMKTTGMYATIASGAMIMAGKKLLELNANQQQAETKLTEIYRKRLGVDKKRAQQTMKVASALQKEGVVGDEVTLSGAQQIATFTKQASTVDKLLPAMDNLLVQQKGLSATTDDAKNIANLFGKALQGQTGALKRVGISFTDAQKKILETGTEEERAAVLAQVVTDNVGEMNKAFAETNEGRMQQLSNTLGDMGERLGHALLPALGQLAGWLSDSIIPRVESLLSFIEAHPVVGKILVGVTAVLTVMGPLLIVIGALISAVGTIMTSVGALSSAFSFLVSPIGLVIAGIVAAIAIGVLLYKNWDKIKAKAKEIVTNVVKQWMLFKSRIVSMMNLVKTSVLNAWTSIKTGVASRVKSLREGVVNRIQSLKNTVSNVFSTIRTKIINAFTGIKDKLTEPFRKAKETISEIVGKIKGLFPISVGKIISNIIKPKIPSIGIEWKNAKKGIFDIKYPSIHWNAEGGIFTKPTVLQGVGEAGPEAIVPLDKLWKAIESNGGDNIVINVYGSDGMSVTALAKEVERRLIESQKRRRVAWQ